MWESRARRLSLVTTKQLSQNKIWSSTREQVWSRDKYLQLWCLRHHTHWCTYCLMVRICVSWTYQKLLSVYTWIVEKIPDLKWQPTYHRARDPPMNGKGRSMKCEEFYSPLLGWESVENPIYCRPEIQFHLQPVCSKNHALQGKGGNVYCIFFPL